MDGFSFENKHSELAIKEGKEKHGNVQIYNVGIDQEMKEYLTETLKQKLPFMVKEGKIEWFCKFINWIIMDQRSMFSLNTYMTTQQEDQTHNEFHEYYYRLLGEVGQEYPTLSKIIFLQLVLRENLIIYTENRVDVRDVWLTIARKLQIKKPNIYVVDAETNIEEILSTKTEYQRTMLYDIHKISNSALNKLLNTVDTSVSFLAIQNPHEKLSPHITDLFSMSFLYSQ